MAEYLDKTGLAYFWSKIKDQYKIATFTTKKGHFPNAIAAIDRSKALNLSNISAEINETFPDGYKVTTITNASLTYYASENDYNNDNGLQVTGQVYVDVQDNGVQHLLATFDEVKMYGWMFRFTAILERA